MALTFRSSSRVHVVARLTALVALGACSCVSAIAQSGPIKVGMALTAHKTVTQFMAYVHAEDDPVRAAAEKVATLRRGAGAEAGEGDDD